MRCSLNEVEVLSLKAARGAGLPWGVAQEAAWAVGWLAARNLDGAAALARTLDALPAGDCSALFPGAADGRWTAPAGRTWGLFAGIAVSDVGVARGAAVTIAAVAEPLPCLPFAAVAGGEAALELVWRDVACRTDMTAAPRGSWLAAGGDAGDLVIRPVVRPAGDTASPLQAGNGVVVDEGARAALEQFARRTYVPESEASRRRGAGGDRIDDD